MYEITRYGAGTRVEAVENTHEAAGVAGASPGRAWALSVCKADGTAGRLIKAARQLDPRESIQPSVDWVEELAEVEAESTFEDEESLARWVNTLPGWDAFSITGRWFIFYEAKPEPKPKPTLAEQLAAGGWVLTVRQQRAAEALTKIETALTAGDLPEAAWCEGEAYEPCEYLRRGRPVGADRVLSLAQAHLFFQLQARLYPREVAS